MKQIIIISLVLLTSITAHAGWFDHHEEERRKQAERALEQQRQVTGQWQFAAAVLGTGCVALLVVGAAIGAKTRKAVKHE